MRRAHAFVSPRARSLVRQIILIGIMVAMSVGAVGFVLIAITVALAEELGPVPALLLMAFFFAMVGLIAFLLSRQTPRRPKKSASRHGISSSSTGSIGSLVLSTLAVELLAPHRRRRLVVPAIAALGAAFLTSRLQSKRRRR